MRVSKGTLQRSLASLQAEVEERMTEGLVARVKRYFFTDPELRKRWALAKAGLTALKGKE